VRADLGLIEPWVEPNTNVLDLGCGDGTLLAYLQNKKTVQGYGLEIGEHEITECIRKGVNVIEHNLDEQDLKRFADKQFDTVIMTQALQAVRRPDQLLDEMLRLGRQGIVTFPNFGHWSCRRYLLFKGRMPVSKTLPYHWYDTPNIHLCTFKDFEALCEQKGIRIVNRTVVSFAYETTQMALRWPNLFAELAIYRIVKN
jgi:methionine biosynthesis protein MetW